MSRIKTFDCTAQETRLAGLRKVAMQLNMHVIKIRVRVCVCGVFFFLKAILFSESSHST